MDEWQEYVGKSQTQSDILTDGLRARFQSTLEGASERHHAPQGVHWCCCLPDTPTAFLGADGHPKRDVTTFLPPVALPRRMWASSAVNFLAPISVGAVVKRTSVIAAVKCKLGASGPLVFVDINHHITADGIAAVQERQTIVYREASTAAPAPKRVAVPSDFSDWQWHRAVTPSSALLFRYSALTFNSHRIHYDLPYARDHEGYRGLVVHGPLTATLLLDLAARALGGNSVKTFAFRGEAPAFADEALHLVGRADNARLTLAALGSDGRTIMSAHATI